MTNDVQPDTAQAIEQGRTEEALDLARLALTRRFGGDQVKRLPLEEMDRTALEQLIVDPPLSINALHARLGRSQEAAVSRNITRQGAPVRVSPLGGYRNAAKE